MTKVTTSRVARALARRVQRGYERLAHPFRLRAAVRRIGRRPPPRVVLVVCHGNICRSPYAAALLRRRLASLWPRTQVTSAGFVGPGRSSPAAAIEVAAARGLDLSGHRSQLLAPAEVFAADLIVVMDTTQRWGVHALFGRHSDDVVVLGDLDPEPIDTREILDPVEQPKEVFELSYGRIERCIDELVRAVSARAQRVVSRGAPSLNERDWHGEETGRQDVTA